MPRTTQARKSKPIIQISYEPKSGLAQRPYVGYAQLAPFVGNLLQSCGLAGTQARGKCQKDVRKIVPRAYLLGSLKGPHGGNEDRKDVKTGSASERRNNLVLERGYVKHFK